MKTMRSRIGRAARPSGGFGGAMVEAALVMPILLLLTAGLVELGEIVYANHRINLVATDVARQAAATFTLDATARTALAGQIVPALAGSGRTVITSATVSAPVNPGGDGIDDYVVQVNVTGQYTTVFLRFIGVANLPVDTTVSMRYEWAAEALS